MKIFFPIKHIEIGKYLSDYVKLLINYIIIFLFVYELFCVLFVNDKAI